MTCEEEAGEGGKAVVDFLQLFTMLCYKPQTRVEPTRCGFMCLHIVFQR